MFEGTFVLNLGEKSVFHPQQFEGLITEELLPDILPSLEDFYAGLTRAGIEEAGFSTLDASYASTQGSVGANTALLEAVPSEITTLSPLESVTAPTLQGEVVPFETLLAGETTPPAEELLPKVSPAETLLTEAPTVTLEIQPSEVTLGVGGVSDSVLPESIGDTTGTGGCL